MTRKIISILGALCCTASLLSLPASAEYKRVCEFIELEGGRLGVISERSSYGLLVGTGDSEMTLETLVPFGYVDPSDMPNCDIDIHYLYTLDEFNAGDYLLGVTLTGGEGNNYVIDAKYMTDEELVTLARQLQTKLDFVKNVQIIHYERISSHVDFQSEYKVTFVDSNAKETLDFSEMPELADFMISRTIGDYTYLRAGDEDSEYRKQFYEDIKDLTGYETYEYLTAFAESIQEKYSDVFATFEPQFLSAGIGEPVSAYTSAWDTAGDSNTDGAVDASDAADVLTIAAQNGTGAGIKATSANDVNADGNVDASDAAAVLCYAAAQGTGAEVSWVDILRK